MNVEVLYVAGPMRGYKNLNFDAFNKKTAELREKGFIVINPVEINPDQDANYLDCMRADIRAITECSGIYLLKGWENSEGANAEYQVARMLKLKVYFE
jgi:hypothetical protein